MRRLAVLAECATAISTGILASRWPPPHCCIRPALLKRSAPESHTWSFPMKSRPLSLSHESREKYVKRISSRLCSGRFVMVFSRYHDPPRWLYPPNMVPHEPHVVVASKATPFRVQPVAPGHTSSRMADHTPAGGSGGGGGGGGGAAATRAGHSRMTMTMACRAIGEPVARADGGSAAITERTKTRR